MSTIMNSALFSLGTLLVATFTGFGATLDSAKVTQVINDVKLFLPSASAKKAEIGDTLSGRTSLQTGRRSRSELHFQDDTITRVGANSIFSFDQGTRDLLLEQGTILLTVPKNAGGARIRTATVTAAVTGTTIMMEYYLKKWVKIIVLEGSLDTWIEQNGKTKKKTLTSGQMLILKADDKRLPDPVDVDLSRLVQTSALMDRQTFGPLPKSAETQIASAVNTQDNLRTIGILVPANRGSNGPGGGLPGTGSGSVSARSTDLRQIVNDTIVIPPPPREGDDPAG